MKKLLLICVTLIGLSGCQLTALDRLANFGKQSNAAEKISCYRQRDILDGGLQVVCIDPSRNYDDPKRFVVIKKQRDAQ